MALTNDRKYLGVVSALTAADKIVLANLRGHCDGIHQGLKAAGLVAGQTSDGKMVLAWSKQWCKTNDGGLIRMASYLGVRKTQTADGKIVLATWCEPCGEPPPPPQHTFTCAPGSPCTEVEVPAAGFTLSITSTDVEYTGGETLPTGDYPLTYQSGICVHRELDQSEQPCIVTVETFADGLFTDEIPVAIGTIRYQYDPCSGALGYIWAFPNPDCPDNDPVVSPGGVFATLTVEVCDPYFADVSDGHTVGSVSA